jgi:hypothetical protein
MVWICCVTAPAYAPAKPRRRWIAGLLGVIIVLGVLGYLAYGKWLDRGGQEVVTTSGGQMNVPVVDGKFIFTVTAVRCHVDNVGDGSVDLEPKGSFCLVDIIARNGSSGVLSFDTTAQVAYDDKGDEHSTDMQAEVVVNPDRNFVNPIPAGNEARGRLAFDVPEGATLTSVVLHESFHTTGAKISLK